MSKFYSPLRYPGGKNKLAPFIAKICIDNGLNGNYIEPYSGGASVALTLLFEGFVDEVIINDKDRSIYAFWHSVLYNTLELCDKIYNCNITIDEWRRQKEIQLKKSHANLFDLGFSTFFLNRTNRSGIINGGPIGGFAQSGEYCLDCRFNKEDLINRIMTIASKKKQIRLYTKDSIRLVDILFHRGHLTKKSLLYFDPPYYLKGPSLYMNHYTHKDHLYVRDAIGNIQFGSWIVSYDPTDEIKNLYSDYRRLEYNLTHTAHSAKNGKEILFFCDNILNIDLNSDPSRYKIHDNPSLLNKIIYDGD